MKVLNISISPRNSKVSCPTFSKRCWRWGTNKECPKCYALKAYHQYPNVVSAWDKNTQATSWEVYQGVSLYLARRPKVKYFRIHSSGEFYTRSEVLTWCDLARDFPNVVFFGYSKEPWVSEVIKMDNAPGNLKIRVNPERNYGDHKWCQFKAMSDPGRYYICPCGMSGVDNKKICGNRCHLCISLPISMLPLFIEH